jgi:hypothetical protein
MGRGYSLCGGIRRCKFVFGVLELEGTCWG